jgi:hypothetical protein
MTFKVNDKVKPAPEFNFALFHGPANADSIGTVIEVQAPSAGFHGLLIVDWDGNVNDHTTAEFTGLVPKEELDNDPALKELIQGMSVVAAE